MKHCLVSYATPSRQWLWRVELDDAATVAEALSAARKLAVDDAIPWDAEVGIFGEFCERTAVPRDGDRIELYRPLNQDPKVSRRARAASARAARDPGAARPRASSPRKLPR